MREVGVNALSQGLDTTTPGGRLFFHTLAAIAGFEHDLFVERTRDGWAAARARGRKGGAAVQGRPGGFRCRGPLPRHRAPCLRRCHGWNALVSAGGPRCMKAAPGSEWDWRPPKGEIRGWCQVLALRFTQPQTAVATRSIRPMMASHSRPFTAKPRMERISQMISSVMTSPIPEAYARAPPDRGAWTRSCSPCRRVTRSCPAVGGRNVGAAAAEPLVHASGVWEHPRIRAALGLWPPALAVPRDLIMHVSIVSAMRCPKEAQHHGAR